MSAIFGDGHDSRSSLETAGLRLESGKRPSNETRGTATNLRRLFRNPSPATEPASPRLATAGDIR